MELQFEFDEWTRLARENPDEFERRRSAAIEAVIARASPELAPRLRGLQFRLDVERLKARTPLGAAVRMQALMWEQFEQLRTALNQLTAPRAVGRQPTAVCGKVLRFPPRD
jgi:hypothetical protein